MSKDVAGSLREVFLPSDPDLGDDDTFADVLDRAVRSVARALQNLGTGDAYTGGKGAIECLAMQVDEGSARVAEALSEIADALRDIASVLNSPERRNQKGV
jgi:hypothetical protein